MPSERVNKIVYQSTSRKLVVDNVIIEQPLQIRLSWQDNYSVQCSQVLTITMRTPGQDKALILGLLLSEGIIKTIKDIESLSLEQNEKDSSELRQENLWEVILTVGVIPKLPSLERYQVTYSSCGLCGSTSLKALELKMPDKLCQKKHWLAINDIYQMPDKMKIQQKDFFETGGAHGAALFNNNGELFALQEDIGRHNAVDKLLGSLLLESETPSEDSPLLKSRSQLAMMISSRVSFEIVQKAVMAGISVLIAVGAPSNLAIQAAKRFDLTLIGFTSSHSFNLYYGEWRLANNHSLEE